MHANAHRHSGRAVKARVCKRRGRGTCVARTEFRCRISRRSRGQTSTHLCDTTDRPTAVAKFRVLPAARAKSDNGAAAVAAACVDSWHHSPPSATSGLVPPFRHMSNAVCRYTLLYYLNNMEAEKKGEGEHEDAQMEAENKEEVEHEDPGEHTVEIR